MNAALKYLGVAGLVLALPACAGSGDRYPSLALRPFETASAAINPVPDTAPPPAIRPVISPAALAALRDKALRAHAAFLEQEPATQRIARAAAGRSVETNARAAALVAMADLSAKRGATSAVLADLDLLAADAATGLVPAPELIAVQTEVAALIAREDAAIARLWEAMGS